MLIHAGPLSIELDDLGKGNAASIAARLASDHGVVGTAFTLKVDGAVLEPTATVAKSARIVELVEQPPATGGTITPPSPAVPTPPQPET